MKLLRLVLIIIFAVFLSRSFFITVVMHDYYASLASTNRVRREVITAPRGIISDRNGRGLAVNILVDGETTRHYPDGEIMGGVVGYTSDGHGAAGLEREYDEQLSGTAGERVFEETARGQETKVVSETLPEAGKEVKLNLDYPLQKAAYSALREKLLETGKAGAVVAMRANGEVLALVSLPGFDPNLFISGGKRGGEGGLYTEAARVLTDSERKPLFNRAVSGVFPPGSVYKLTTALAGLSEGVVGEDDLIEDSGEITIGSYSFGNWYFDKYGKTEGKINITKALARSNDIFFYRLGERIGVDNLVVWSRRLGLGEKTGIDLPGEAVGLVPSPLWREKEEGERWFLGNTYNMAIGQGDLLTTPLQVNRMVAGVVTGELCQPRLYGESACSELPMPLTARKTIIEGMRMACMNGGTGFPFFSLKGAVLCKTGTAQHGGEGVAPHSWISVVVPEGQWRDWLVLTVLVDEAGEGSEVAGPVARVIVDYYLKNH